MITYLIRLNQLATALTPSGEPRYYSLSTCDVLLLCRLKTSQHLGPHLLPLMTVSVLRRLVPLLAVDFSNCVEERPPALQTWVPT